jgi:hypothetical protein
MICLVVHTDYALNLDRLAFGCVYTRSYKATRTLLHHTYLLPWILQRQERRSVAFESSLYEERTQGKLLSSREFATHVIAQKSITAPENEYDI